MRLFGGGGGVIAAGCQRWLCSTSTNTSTQQLIPVTLLTGFLGSGKTTLLNWILSAAHGKRLAVIQNEFGAIGIDDTLVGHHFEHGNDDIFYTSNGCLCCTVRSELTPMLSKLYSAHRSDGLDGIIIETTGLAKPSAIAETIFQPPQSDFCSLDSVVAMADAKHIEQQLAMEGGEAVEQLIFADHIVLNKCDVVLAEEADRVATTLQRYNPTAVLSRATHAKLPLEALLGRASFEIERVAEWIDTDTAAHSHGHGHGHSHGHSHTHEIGVTSVSIELDGHLDYHRLEQWLVGLAESSGDKIFRMKGVFAVMGEDGKPAKRKLVFQSVHSLINGDWLGKWQLDEPRKSQLVVIGKLLNEDELREGFRSLKA